MKNVLMGFALLTVLSTAAAAHDKKDKKAKAKASTETKCDKMGGTGCCMKKAQA